MPNTSPGHSQNLPADQAEADGERRAHDDAHERLDRQTERTERQRRARAFALSAAEGKDAERNDKERRRGVLREQHIRRLTGADEVIRKTGAVVRAVDHKIGGGRAETQMIKQVAVAYAVVGLAVQAQQTLVHHLNRERREIDPQLKQQRDNRVAAEDGRKCAHRVHQQEKEDVAEYDTEVRTDRNRFSEAHRVRTHERQHAEHQIRRDNAHRTGYEIHKIQLFARNRQAVVKVHLALVVQIGEHRRAGHNGKQDNGELYERVLAADVNRCVRQTGFPALRKLRRSRAIDNHTLAVLQRLLHIHQRGQEHGNHECERRENDRPQAAAHAVAHQSLRRGAS